MDARARVHAVAFLTQDTPYFAYSVDYSCHDVGDLFVRLFTWLVFGIWPDVEGEVPGLGSG